MKNARPTPRGKAGAAAPLRAVVEPMLTGFEEAAAVSHANELQARALLAGWSVEEDGAGFIVSRWGLSRRLPDLAAVHGFLRRAGVCDG